MIVLCLSIFIAVADQITKYLARHFLCLGRPVPIVSGFFNLTYIQNTGAAWGRFQGFNDLLVVMSVIVLILMIVFRRSFFAGQLTQKIALGLVVGGIIGNLIDRLKLDYVVDFLDFCWKSKHFPAFNIADSAICIGVGLYMLLQIKGNRSQEKTVDGKQKDA
ncbi:signal peptidase II [Verrucomicrobiota bacterium]